MLAVARQPRRPRIDDVNSCRPLVARADGTCCARQTRFEGTLFGPVQPPEKLVEYQQIDGGFNCGSMRNDQDRVLIGPLGEAKLL